MAEIRPFRGLIYNPGKIGGDRSSVVAPPYDVIPENMRDELYEKNPYNVIRLILGKASSKDSGKNNKYTRAGQLLDEWQKKGALARDEAESFYVYAQEYDYNGTTFRRIGFLGLMKIEEPGERSVIPHEHTLAKPKEDRLNLIREVRGNLSPIFVLFEDGSDGVTDILEKTVSQSEPLIDVEAPDGKHRIWRVSGEDSVKRIASMMKEKKVYIADGHHRYEVAKTYRDEQRKLEGYDGKADYMMMYFTEMTGKRPGNDLTVVATHRAVKLMPVAEDEIENKVRGHFEVEECAGLSDLLERMGNATGKEHFFGYFGGTKHLLLKLKEEADLSELVNEDRSMEWKQLDVSILHAGILKNLLGLKEAEGNITYVKDPAEGEGLVKDKSHMAAFFLNPTRVEQIKLVAESGDMMPQKSTYFYPKLLSGLLINKFD